MKAILTLKSLQTFDLLHMFKAFTSYQ